MINLSILAKSINSLETYTAKYIYKKYIEVTPSPEATTAPVSTPATTPATTLAPTPATPSLDSEIKFKYSKKPNSVEEYKLYTDEIFNKERKHIIKQSDILTEDLDNISIADDEYETNPESFNRRKNKSYPDIIRCSYIRKYKNKLLRCKNGIISNDDDMCSKHEDKPNIYWDMYSELVDKTYDN